MTSRAVYILTDIRARPKSSATVKVPAFVASLTARRFARQYEHAVVLRMAKQVCSHP